AQCSGAIMSALTAITPITDRTGSLFTQAPVTSLASVANATILDSCRAAQNFVTALNSADVGDRLAAAADDNARKRIIADLFIDLGKPATQATALSTASTAASNAMRPTQTGGAWSASGPWYDPRTHVTNIVSGVVEWLASAATRLASYFVGIFAIIVLKF